MNKEKLIKALEYIETTKHNVSFWNKILTINLIRYIETGNYYNIFGILNQELETVCDSYEEIYRNRLLNIIKQKNIFLFSKKYIEIEYIELSEGYKKCCGIAYIDLLNLFKENKYEDIYNMINSDIIYYLNNNMQDTAEKELKIELHYEKLKNKLHEYEQKKEESIEKIMNKDIINILYNKILSTLDETKNEDFYELLNVFNINMKKE